MTLSEEFIKGILESNENFTINKNGNLYLISQHIDGKVKYIMVAVVVQSSISSFIDSFTAPIAVVKDNKVYLKPGGVSYEIREEFLDEILKDDNPVVCSFYVKFMEFCSMFTNDILLARIQRYIQESGLDYELSDSMKNRCIVAARETTLFNKPMPRWMLFDISNILHKDFVDFLKESITPEEIVDCKFKNADTLDYYMEKYNSQKYYKELLQNTNSTVGGWLLQLSNVCKDTVARTVEVEFQLNNIRSKSRIELSAIQSKLSDYENKEISWCDFQSKSYYDKVCNDLSIDPWENDLRLNNITTLRYRGKIIYQRDIDSTKEVIDEVKDHIE